MKMTVEQEVARYDQMIEQLKEMRDKIISKYKKEWVPFPGELAEVSDDQKSWQTRPVLEHNPYAEYPYISDAVNWRHARPLSDPNVIQLRPHDLNNPMPCDGNQRVLVRLRNGKLVHGFAREWEWEPGKCDADRELDIVAWTPL